MNDKTVKNPYFEIIKLVDELFPSTSELDYTKVSTEDLISRIEAKTEESGMQISPERIEAIRKSIRENQRFVYQRKTNLVSTIDDPGFDQNNYFVKSQVIRMKNDAFRAIHGPIDWIRMVDKDGSYSTSEFGDVETIESVVTQENVEKYLRDVLSVTCSDKDNLATSLFDISTIVVNILNHFGIRHGSSISSDTYDRVSNLVEKVVNKTIRGEGRVYPGNSDTLYQQSFERYVTDMSSYNSEIETLVKKITAIICEIALPAVEKTKEEEAERSKALEERKAKEEKKAEAREQKKAEPREPKPRQVEPRKVEPREPKKQPVVEPERLDDTIKKYESMKVLMQENAENAKELQTLIKQINELKQKLSGLEKRKSALEQKINRNNDQIRKGL